MNPALASQKSVLVVSDVASDAALVKSLLDPEVEKVLTAMDNDAASEIFRQSRIPALVLAFKSLEKATRFCVGLYRRGSELKIPVHAHRLIALCDRRDVLEAFELCTSGQIHDYVQFWPTTHDAPRLLMSVRGALRDCSGQATSAQSNAALVVQGERLAQLEEMLAQYMQKGTAHLATATQALEKTDTGIRSGLAGLSKQILQGSCVQLRPGRESGDFTRELSGYSAESILPHLRGTANALEPLTEWAGRMDNAVTPQIRSARAQLQRAMPVGRTILIVDDDQFQRQMVGRVVEAEGYRPFYAGNGTEALSMIRKAPPDLILMDVLMPDVSGLEVVQQLKADPASAKIPVIMVTGESVREVVLASVKLGVADFLVKPIERNNLLGKIARLLALAASNSA